MITSPQEYNELLSQLVNPNDYIKHIQVPTDEPVYKIDLNARTVEKPDFIAVTEDHNAEILWFSTDRFYDCYDLAQCNCWIQYTNAKGEAFFYAAPIIVKGESDSHDTILIPWAISKEAAAESGTINFAFLVFTLSEDGLRFTYMLNTLPTKTKVLASLKSETDPDLDAKKEFAAETLEAIYDKLRQLSGDYNLFWIEA